MNSSKICEIIWKYFVLETKNTPSFTMDAIRKKMQSLKAETDGLYATIQKFEDATKEYNRQADQVRNLWTIPMNIF